MGERNLTDDDVRAVVDALEHRLAEKFYTDLGRGLWGLAKKGLILAVVGIAAYGAIKGIK